MSEYKVYVSPVAEFKLDKLHEYLIITWGEQAKSNVLQEFESAVNKVANCPLSSPKTTLPDRINKYIVTKQTSFYNQISGNTIEILTITDNRQNSESLINEIRNLRKLIGSYSCVLI